MLTVIERKWFVGGLVGVVLLGMATVAVAEVNRVANPGFEAMGTDGFFADWERGVAGKVGKVLFVESETPHAGKHSLRMVGTPSSWTTCAARPIAVEPETDYWVTWWCKAKQPPTGRTYLFLQTNLAQRVFPATDRNGDSEGMLNIVHYRTRPGETTLHPVLAMQSA